MKALFIFVLMAIPKVACIEKWDKTHLLRTTDGKIVKIDDGVPQPHDQFSINLSSSSPAFSTMDKECYDIYIGKVSVPLKKVK